MGKIVFSGMHELSIIVPVQHNPHMDKVVRALLEQSAPPESYEVVVVDLDGGVQQQRVETEARRNSRVSVRYVQLTGDVAWRARALNAGIAAATGSILVFLAGDFIPLPNFVEAHREFHHQHPNPKAVAIGPGQFAAEHAAAEFLRWLEANGKFAGKSPQEAEGAGFFFCANASLKREFLAQAGPFDEDFHYDCLDDFELGERLRRAGMESHFLPSAATLHEHEAAPTLAERRTAMLRSGASAVVYEKKYPGPYDWSRTCVKSPLRLEWEALHWGARYLISRRKSDLDSFDACRCDAAFVRGWRRARRHLAMVALVVSR